MPGVRTSPTQIPNGKNDSFEFGGSRRSWLSWPKAGCDLVRYFHQRVTHQFTESRGAAKTRQQSCQEVGSGFDLSKKFRIACPTIR